MVCWGRALLVCLTTVITTIIIIVIIIIIITIIITIIIVTRHAPAPNLLVVCFRSEGGATEVLVMLGWLVGSCMSMTVALILFLDFCSNNHTRRRACPQINNSSRVCQSCHWPKRAGENTFRATEIYFIHILATNVLGNASANQTIFSTTAIGITVSSCSSFTFTFVSSSSTAYFKGCFHNQP